MSLSMSDFDEAYSSRSNSKQSQPGQIKPACTPPACFIGSYPAVSRPGESGPFMVNTYFLRPDRRQEITGGGVAVTATQYKNKFGC